MKINVSDLTGAALDWAVAKCEVITQGSDDYEPCIPRGNPRYRVGINCDGNGFEPWEPSADWSQGGPIIEREIVSLDKEEGGKRWAAFAWRSDRDLQRAIGHTPLIAAMRCYVASKMGDEIEVSEVTMEVLGI